DPEDHERPRSRNPVGTRVSQGMGTESLSGFRVPPRSHAPRGNAGPRRSASRPAQRMPHRRSCRDAERPGRAFPRRAWERVLLQSKVLTMHRRNLLAAAFLLLCGVHPAMSDEKPAEAKKL